MSKVVLTTLPEEGQFVNWTTPKFFDPARVNKYMPLGLLSLATNLPQHHNIKILDPPSHGWTIQETINNIEKEKPDILGISAVTRRVYALNQILEKTSTQYKVVGGPHAKDYAEDILEKGADAVLIGGLADLEFKDAVENLTKGIIHCNTQIKDIKYPRRDFLDVKEYFPKASTLFKAENRLPMFSSVGCPNQCNFCNVQSKLLQLKDPVKVVDEMQHLYSIGSRSIHVLDDNFNIIPSHVNGIIDEMKKRNFQVEWSGRGQIKMDLSLCEGLAKSGFKRIHVGFEGFSDEILKFFNKNLTMNKTEEFCKEMNKQGIDMLGYFILGTPLDTPEYWKEFPKKVKELGIKYPFFNMLFPEPDTEYYKNLLKEGLYKEDHWADYMKNPTPYYEIPYPYGESRKQELIKYVDGLIQEFRK